MWSRRAACESITTRRRFRAAPLRAGAAEPPSPASFAGGDFACWAPAPSVGPSAVFVADDFVLACCFGAGAFAGAALGAGFVLVAAPPPEAPSPEPFRAASASDSSTLD
jgi:hypothetical protein